MDNQYEQQATRLEIIAHTLGRLAPWACDQIAAGAESIRNLHQELEDRKRAQDRGVPAAFMIEMDTLKGENERLRSRLAEALPTQGPTPEP